MCGYVITYTMKNNSDTLEELLDTLRKSRSVGPRLILSKVSKKTSVRILKECYLCCFDDLRIPYQMCLCPFNIQAVRNCSVRQEKAGAEHIGADTKSSYTSAGKQSAIDMNCAN